MKKLFLFISILISINSFSQAGASTATLQVQEIRRLDTIAARDAIISRAYSSGDGLLRNDGISVAQWAELTFNALRNSTTFQNYLGTVNNKLDSLINGLTTVTLTSAPSTATASGTVSAGSRMISVKASSDFSGTLDGQVFVANETFNISSGDANRLPAIPYTVTTGSLIIRRFY